jgi:hypothetical protein
MTKIICRNTECKFNTGIGIGECTEDRIVVSAFGRVICKSNFQITVKEHKNG